MTDALRAHLIGLANATGRPLGEVIRHHFLEVVLRRLAGDESFALAGSMLTRVWAGAFPRAAADLDFLGTFAHGLDETARRFLTPLAGDCGDGVRIDPARGFAKGIWLDTPFPGVRLSVVAELLGRTEATTVDVWFNDPLVPPAERLAYPTVWGEPVPVFAVHRATLAAWKLHGLAEWGVRTWRAKDVLDLWLLTAAPLPAETLAVAIRAAFLARGFAVADAERVLVDAARWNDRTAQPRWAAVFKDGGAGPAPAKLTVAIADIRARLSGPLSLLRTTP